MPSGACATLTYESLTCARLPEHDLIMGRWSFVFALAVLGMLVCGEDHANKASNMHTVPLEICQVQKTSCDRECFADYIKCPKGDPFIGYCNSEYNHCKRVCSGDYDECVSDCPDCPFVHMLVNSSECAATESHLPVGHHHRGSTANSWDEICRLYNPNFRCRAVRDWEGKVMTDQCWDPGNYGDCSRVAFCGP